MPFLRSARSARDESKTIDCVLESLQNYKKLGREFEVLFLLQPTSPLRQALHIQEAYETFLLNGCKGLASACEVRESPLFMRTLEGSHLYSLLSQDSSVRRQDLKRFYRLNGAIYCNLISELCQSTSFNDNPIGYVMNQECSLDIDTQEDFIP